MQKESGPTNQEIPSYAHAVGAIYRNADPSDIVVTAAGGLVGEVVQIWKPKQLNTFETEWGFSCMGYEISGALGIKMAKPEQDVVVFVGDGSYLLQNSDIYSSVLYDQKLIIVICDNGGHMVINRLQLAKGGNEYICNLERQEQKTFNLLILKLTQKAWVQMEKQLNLLPNLKPLIREQKHQIKHMSLLWKLMDTSGLMEQHFGKVQH